MNLLHQSNDKKYVSRLEKLYSVLMSKKELAYLRLPFEKKASDEAIAWAQTLKQKGCKQLAILGMGGSYLGAKAISNVLAPQNTDLLFFHSSDPDSYQQTLQQITDINSCHFLVISKSGNTVETLLLTNLIFQLLSQHKINHADAITIITENKSSPLYDFAKKNKITAFEHPADVGGRYSVFSAVGLFPLTFISADITSLLLGARNILESKDKVLDFSNEVLCSFDRGEWVTIFWPYKDSMVYWCDWVLQLWAESLGKHANRSGKAASRVSTPTYCLGSISQHSILQNILEGHKDKFVIFLSESKIKNRVHAINQFDTCSWLSLDMNQIFQLQKQSTIESLKHFNISHLEISLPEFNAESIGELIMLMQASIGLMGEFLDIDVYNQPSVEVGKQILQSKISKL